MREYVIVLIGSVLVCSLAVMLSPEGEKGMAQYVKLAAGLCVLCVLISPLTSFVSSISELIEQNRSFDGTDNSLDNFEKIYNESLLDASGEEIANALESMLCREFGFKNDEIDVYVELCEGEDGYLPECVYEYPMFKNKSAFKGTHAPFDSPYYGGNVSYDTGICPIAEEILETSLKLELDEFSTEEDIEDIIKAIKKVADYYLEKKKNG